MHHEFTTIEELIQYAQARTDSLGKGIFFIGTLPPTLALAVEQVSSLQVAGYRIAIDHSAIIHIQRKHGQPSEILQGQIPVTLADIAQLAERLLSPTRIADAGQKPGQPRCLQFEMETPAALIIAIMEVRPGRKRQQLALKTCYKKRPTT